MANKWNATKRKDGLFEIKVSVGTNKRVSVYGKTEAEVRKKARAAAKQAAIFDLSNISKMTLREYMTNWLITVKQPTLKAKSYDRVEQSLVCQIFPEIGDIQLNALTSIDIQLMLNRLIDRYSYSTVKKAYDNLNNCLNLGVIRGEIIRNPADGVVLPKEKSRTQKEIRHYTPEEVKKIVEAAAECFKNGKPKYRYGYAIILILNTGMRLGEALYLKWKDVDFEKRLIYVHGTTIEHKDHGDNHTNYIVHDQEMPKTDSSNRYIPINDCAVEALHSLKDICKDEYRVIATENHTIVRQNRIFLTMKSILSQCGIENVNDKVHALRHTFATTLIRQGIDIKVVSELLGHSDVTTTMKIYYHVAEEQKQLAVTALNNLY